MPLDLGEFFDLVFKTYISCYLLGISSFGVSLDFTAFLICLFGPFDVTSLFINIGI